MKIKKNISILFITLVFFIFGCSETSKKNSENEALVKSFMESWSMHDVDKLVSLFSDSCLYEEVASGRKYSDKQGIANYAKSTLSGVPDSKFEIISIITSDSMAVVEWIWKGTNSVGWPSLKIPATNKYFEIRGVSVMAIEANHIKRNSDYWDWNTFIKGIGAE